MQLLRGMLRLKCALFGILIHSSENPEEGTAGKCERGKETRSFGDGMDWGG